MSDKVLISELHPVEYNPRKISKKFLSRLVSSIREHTKALENWDLNNGFRLASTITVNRDGNRIVGGHQRVEALLNLKQDWIHGDDITWVSLTPDSPEEKSLCLSLNNDQAAGRWDTDKLNQVVLEVHDEMEELFDNLDFSSLQKQVLDASNSDEAAEKLSAIRKQEIVLKDNVSFVVQEILDKYGETVPQGFVFFAYKNRLHLIVQCDEPAYEAVKVMSEGLKRENRSINAFLLSALVDAFDTETWNDLVGSAERLQYSPVSPEDIDEDDLLCDNTDK